MKINCIGIIAILYLGKIKNIEKIERVKNKWNNKYPFSKLSFLIAINMPNEEKMLSKKIGIINNG